VIFITWIGIQAPYDCFKVSIWHSWVGWKFKI
jgi:hypothetical protein